MTYRSGRSSSSDDTPLGVEIIARILAALVTVVINVIIVSIWYAPPETGNVVAIASTGDDGVATHWECIDKVGVYDCSSQRSGDGSGENRQHYEIPADYEVVDTYGNTSSYSKKFLLRNKSTNRFYSADVGTRETDFEILEEVVPECNEGTLASVAERRRNDFYNYYVVGDGNVFLCRDGKFERQSIAKNHRFLEATAFSDSKPKLWCRAPNKDIVKCPEDAASSLRNMVSADPIVAVYALILLIEAAFLFGMFSALARRILVRVIKG